MYYFRCDGTFTESAGTMSCDQWIAVPEETMFANAGSYNRLTADEFGVLAGAIITFMTIAFGFRLIRRLFNL